jgi:hypothetical protein
MSTIVRNPAKITLRNILAVAQAWKRKYQKEWFGFELPPHIQEQIIWRRTEVMQKSPICWNQGKCVECGCEILGKTIEDRGCSNIENPCYPAIMSKENWESYKRINNIKLFL